MKELSLQQESKASDGEIQIPSPHSRSFIETLVLSNRRKVRKLADHPDV